jgi:hypothetical protein
MLREINLGPRPQKKAYLVWVRIFKKKKHKVEVETSV